MLTRTFTTALAAVATLVLATALFAWMTNGEMATAGVEGVLEVGGSRYEFEPSACTVTASDFVAAGRGTTNGEPFWVSASRRGVTLTVGTTSDVERPGDDHTWLTSVGEPRWQQDGEVLTVEARMRDRRAAGKQVDVARLAVTCSEST